MVVCFYDHINMSKYLDGLITVKIGDHRNPFIKSFRLKKWIAQNKAEILGDPFFFGGKAGFYGAIFNNNYVLHYTDPPSLLSNKLVKTRLNNPFSLLRNRLSYLISRNGVNRAKDCITMTKWNARELELLYGRPFDVIYQGGLPPQSSINEAQRCKDPVLRIFSICRLTASKNLDWILEVAQHLKRNATSLSTGFKFIEIVIAGSGPQMDYLRELTEKSGLTEFVSFPGFLSNVEVEDQYNKTDLFLVPARQGFGLPVLEALYRHVPVVINKESRISELLVDNPWVAISGNTVEDFKNTVVNHILQIKKHYPDKSALVNLPTEQGWAFEIGQKCKWW
jgi:glycosyltransferase involved in cell wall biosynthesis